MKVSQLVFSSKSELSNFLKDFRHEANDFYIAFADKSYFHDNQINNEISKAFGNAILAGCSSSGEISNKKFSEGTFILTAVKLEKSRIKKCCYKLKDVSESREAGVHLAKQLQSPDLKHVFILSDGINVNGTRLIEGINSVYDEKINVSGGLAGDNGDFVKTYVADADNHFVSNCITAIGFYGNHIQTESGSYGGWDSFGVDRKVTKSSENIVYEIDGKPALELYKSYLGEKAAELPGSALFFPLEMVANEKDEQVVRTILGVNESDNSMTFAGNIPEGSYVKLMKTNMDRVIDGAEKSARSLNDGIRETAELLLMVSCVGRKLVLKQLTQDEADAVIENFNSKTVSTGFYSYGEISKGEFHSKCSLHNQTMTVTAVSEQ